MVGLGSRNREEKLASRDLEELQAWQSTGLRQLWVGSMQCTGCEWPLGL